MRQEISGVDGEKSPERRFLSRLDLGTRVASTSIMSFKRILVGLALTDRIDGPVLRYAGMLASKIGCEKIYFEHVAPSLDLPDSEPVDESIRRQMGALLDRFFKAEKKVDVETDVTAGSAVVELARRSRRS